MGNIENINTHYVVIGVSATIKTDTHERPYTQMNSQHSDNEWMTIDNLMNNIDVHENTKKYINDMMM